jgi:hypothetical protein
MFRVTPRLRFIEPQLASPVVNRDIIVTMPETGFSVTYRTEGQAPMLVAIEGLGPWAGASEVKFWAQAWKAAHKKERAVGWLNS